METEKRERQYSKKQKIMGYTIVFHKTQQMSETEYKQVEIGVEVNETENIDQLFKRITRQVGSSVMHPEDFITIRVNHIKL